MSDIGKILPVDGYFVLQKGKLPADYAKSLTHLYQPLIGIYAVALYQLLLHEIELQQDEVQTHHTLMNYLNVPLDEIYRSRLKLEGIGLLKTFENKTADKTVYTYQLEGPFSTEGFFKDDMLAQLLYHHLGNTKFQLLKDHYGEQHPMQKGTNITASFSDVYGTFQPYQRDSIMEEVQDTETFFGTTVIDFTWIRQMLKQRMIPVHKVLTPANGKLMSQMMLLYDLEAYEIEKAVLWALTEENDLNPDEFKEACHDLFKEKYHQTRVKLVEKIGHGKQDEPHKGKPVTKEEQLIHELENISPKQLLEDLSSGNHASEQDMKAIREVMTKQGLPAPVMNVLIHYVLLQSNMKLSRAYLDKIASHWSRANLKSAKEAMAFARNEKIRYQKGAAKKQYYRKPVSKEVIPDWFIEHEEKQKEKMLKAQNREPEVIDEEKDKEEIMALLRKHSSKNKK